MQSLPKKLSTRLTKIQENNAKQVTMIKQTSSNFRKTSRAYTQIIFEDDMLFHNIKVKGSTLQSPIFINKDIPVKRSKTSNSERKSTLKKSILNVKRQRKTVTNWTERANKIYKKQNTSGTFKNHSRSITVQSVDMQKYINDCKSDTKILNTQPNLMQRQTKYPNITYKEQNLNTQIYCNFKEIIDQFNKVKKMIKVKSQQSNKPPKAAERHFRQTSYKKPNIYQYQQFYRQNYHHKQAKDTIFLFKKCDNSDNHQEQKSPTRKQGPYIGKKISNNFKIDTCYQNLYKCPVKDSRVCVHMDSPSHANHQNLDINSKKAPCNYLHITSKMCSMSEKFSMQPRKTKRSGFNRSEVVCCQDFSTRENESEKIEPWASFINHEDAT